MIILIQIMTSIRVMKSIRIMNLVRNDFLEFLAWSVMGSDGNVRLSDTVSNAIPRSREFVLCFF